MGVWEPEIAPVGVKQRWRPAYLGDWPKDPDPSSADFRLGCLPKPCPTCGGELWRWVSVIGATSPAMHERTLRHWRAAGRPAPEPQPEPGYEVRNYDLRCFRDAHFRSSAASTEGIDLKPHRRI